MRGVFFICLCACFMLYSCIDAPDYPIVPHIEFKSVSSTLIKSGAVDTITFSFTDGDGDIGVRTAPSDSDLSCRIKRGDSSQLFNVGFNVFLINTKDSCVDSYASATIDPAGKYKGISGDILILHRVFTSKCITPQPGCPNDTITYNVVIRDRAGHLSNFIQTPKIIVNGEP